MDRRQSTEELINQLNEILTDAWQMPLSGGKVLVERDRVSDLLNEINATFPEELQQAKAIINAQNDLKHAAERDSEAIIRDAETRARHLVDETVIVREAKRVTTEMLSQKKTEAQSIIDNANAQANEIITEAKNKAAQLLNDANAKSAEIVSNSEQHAAAVTANAEKVTHDLKIATSSYIENSVAITEKALLDSMNELKRIKAQIHNGATQK